MQPHYTSCSYNTVCIINSKICNITDPRLCALKTFFIFKHDKSVTYFVLIWRRVFQKNNNLFVICKLIRYMLNSRSPWTIIKLHKWWLADLSLIWELTIISSKKHSFRLSKNSSKSFWCIPNFLKFPSPKVIY